MEKLRSLYRSQPVANVLRSAITFESILNMPNRMSSSGECVCVWVCSVRRHQAMELLFTHKRTHTIPFENNYKQKHSHRIKSNYLRKWTLNETESTRELAPNAPKHTLANIYTPNVLHRTAKCPKCVHYCTHRQCGTWSVRARRECWMKKTFFWNYLELIKTKLQWSRRTVRQCGTLVGIQTYLYNTHVCTQTVYVAIASAGGVAAVAFLANERIWCWRPI